jgi:hypothetical protein
MCSVNLYVTGLIIFYAGQIAKKSKNGNWQISK